MAPGLEGVSGGAMPKTLERLRRRLEGLLDRRRGHDGAQAQEDTTWTCQCGQAFRVTGRDRHQVLWPEGADAGEPVLSGRCPSCDRPLPGANPA